MREAVDWAQGNGVGCGKKRRRGRIWKSGMCGEDRREEKMKGERGGVQTRREVRREERCG